MDEVWKILWGLAQIPFMVLFVAFLILLWAVVVTFLFSVGKWAYKAYVMRDEEPEEAVVVKEPKK